MKLRTMVVMAGVMGWASLAHAQPPPDPPAPPAAPPADPNAPPAPPADPNAPPAPPADAPPAPPPPTPEPPPSLPATPPPPPPAISFENGNPPAIDSVQAPAPAKKQNPFAFTWFTWTQSASAKILGVGRDFIGRDDEVYNWDFTLSPRYAFVNTPVDQAYLSASVGVQVELTNSDTTTEEHQWLWKDTQLGVGWSHVVYESKDKEWKDTPNASFSVLLPTSKASADEGKYFATSLGLSDRALVKLRGTKHNWFPNVLVIGAFSYQHLFSRTYDPSNTDLNRPREDASGNNLLSDQLSMSSFNEDQVKFQFIYYLTIWKDLSFGNAWGVTVPFKHQFTPTKCDVVTMTDGCLSVANNPLATTGTPITNFDVSLSYDFLGLGRLDVGYNNEAPELFFDGHRGSMFYNPETAQFYVDVVAYLDAIYDKSAEKLRKNKGSANAHLPAPGLHY